jgi:3-oxoacyl-[acyl-carrier protein] reductase
MAPVLDRGDVADTFVRQTPLGRIADGGDIADVVSFLASPGARWITGVSLAVDGGMSLREHPTMLDRPLP